MDSTTASRSSHRTAAAAFEQYVSGRRSVASGTVFFLETADHLDPVCRIATRGDVVIAPLVSAPTAAGLRTDPTRVGGVPVIGYEGSWHASGDRLRLDGHHVFTLQDYVGIPFLSAAGRVVVRQRTARGVAAFFCDADTARHFGVFVNPLLSRAVLLDSGDSFVHAGPAGGAVVRVHVTSGGEYRDGADGLLLGRVGDERRDIETTAAADAGRGRSFARIIDRDHFGAELDERPWFESYLAAIRLLRRWDGRSVRPAVSGFGGHVSRDRVFVDDPSRSHLLLGVGA